MLRDGQPASEAEGGGVWGLWAGMGKKSDDA